MATIDEAKDVWLAKQQKFVPVTETRIAYLGTGLGFATSDMVVEGNPGLIYARGEPNGKNYFPILNRNIISPKFNLPVVLGYTADEPQHEQVLSVDAGYLDHNPQASVIGGLGPHHNQHEFGGGDEVFIDGRLFKPGLLKPTFPVSASATIQSFVHYYKGWQRFAQQNTIAITDFKPTNDARKFVLVAIDPETNSIVYRVGASFSDQLPDAAVNGGFRFVPAPAGDEIPIGAVSLGSATTTVDWNSTTTDNIHDMRIHHSVSSRHMLDRISQLEGHSGNNPNIATLGAADASADEVDQIRPFSTRIITTTHTATKNDDVILCDASGGAFTITLPAAVNSTGIVLHIKKIDSSVNSVTVDGNSSETIDDATTAIITTQYESIQIICTGSEWFII